MMFPEPTREAVRNILMMFRMMHNAENISENNNKINRELVKFSIEMVNEHYNSTGLVDLQSYSTVSAARQCLEPWSSNV